jgi:hypothetical protein
MSYIDMQNVFLCPLSARLWLRLHAVPCQGRRDDGFMVGLR